MEIVLYIGMGHTGPSAAEQVMACVRSTAEITLLRSVMALEARLRTSSVENTAVILVPADREDMLQLNGIGELLSTMRLVLLLPHENDPQWLTWAHRLYPRYLGYQSNGFSGLGDVLDKMTASVTRHSPCTQSGSSNLESGPRQ